MQTQKTTETSAAKTSITIDALRQTQMAALRGRESWTPWSPQVSGHAGSWNGHAAAYGTTAGYPGHAWPQSAWMPGWTCLDVADEGSHLVCCIDMPGVSAGDIELVCTESSLAVTGIREATTATPTVLHQERGPIQRSISLPTPIRREEVEATLGNGVLTVRMPKCNPTEAPRRVEIRGLA